MADATDHPYGDPSRAGDGRPRPVASRPWFVYKVIRRFFRLPSRRRFLIAEAVAWLALARLALLFVPFRVLAARFGTLAAPDGVIGTVKPLPDLQSIQARDVGWAVTRAARYVPFRAVCLPQAIAAKGMLSRRHVASVLHFGVLKKPAEALAAHAWLHAGQVEVTGYPVEAGFVEVVQFR